MERRKLRKVNEGIKAIGRKTDVGRNELIKERNKERKDYRDKRK